MSSDEPAEDDGKPVKISVKSARARVAWHEEEDRCLLATLAEQKMAGNQADSGWKSSVWSVCARNLKAKGFEGKSAKKCQTHFAFVSNDCLIYSFAF